MAKNRKKKTSATPESASSNKRVVNIEEVNLRTAGPVTRLRGVMSMVAERVDTVVEKLTNWSEENKAVEEVAGITSALAADISSILDKLEDLELSGFSPQRKSFTAKTSEGDHVSLLEMYRPQYDDLIERKQMNDLVVIRKHENRGGLVLETTEGTRLKAAAAHVVRLSQPQAID